MKIKGKSMTACARFLVAMLAFPAIHAFAQTDGHYTMFMFNKLAYNPAYAGEKELTTINAVYRDQWTDLPGAPRTFNFSVDAPIGKFTRRFRPVALGLNLSNEHLGVEKYTTLMANYAYRFPLKNATLSLGLRGGTKLYSADYSQLDIAHTNDPNFQGGVSSLVLPNFGFGAFWSAKDKNQRDRYFLGISIPMLLQNHYGKNTQNNSVLAKETRTIYTTAGYVFQTGKNSPFAVTPQAILRFVGNSRYHLPVICDFNLSATYRNRIMSGVTYRTDRSMEFIIHLQVLQEVHIGYAYDYSGSPVSPYLGGTHEMLVGFDVIRKNAKYVNPRFIRSF